MQILVGLIARIYFIRQKFTLKMVKINLVNQMKVKFKVEWFVLFVGDKKNGCKSWYRLTHLFVVNSLCEHCQKL